MGVFIDIMESPEWVKYEWNRPLQPQTVRFCNLVGTGIAPVSKKMLLGRNSKTNFRICTSIENLDFTFSEKSQEENACKTFCLCKHSIELKSWVFCSEILQTSWEFRFLAMHLCFTMDSNPVWIRNKISVLQFYPFWSGIKIVILLPI